MNLIIKRINDDEQHESKTKCLLNNKLNPNMPYRSHLQKQQINDTSSVNDNIE